MSASLLQPRVIILADGVGERWTADVPKHMAVVDGEAILPRTVRQLTERGFSDLWLTSRMERYDAIPSIRRYVPVNNHLKIDQFYACREIWAGLPDVVFLYGDVRFSDAAMDTIFKTVPHDYAYFQRTFGSRITGKGWKEGFAMRVCDTSAFEAAVESLRSGIIGGFIQPAPHQVQGYLEGMGVDHFRGCGPHGVEIDDETDDFDRPSDVRTWTKNVTRWRARQESKP